jgi:hypothetical protein
MKDHTGAVTQIQRILEPSQGRAYLSVGKFCRKKDPRTVLDNEWETIVRNYFKLEDSGQGVTSKWALVKKREVASKGLQGVQTEREEEKEKRPIERENTPPSPPSSSRCCCSGRKKPTAIRCAGGLEGRARVCHFLPASLSEYFWT